MRERNKRGEEGKWIEGDRDKRELLEWESEGRFWEGIASLIIIIAQPVCLLLLLPLFYVCFGPFHFFIFPPPTLFYPSSFLSLLSSFLCGDVRVHTTHMIIYSKFHMPWLIHIWINCWTRFTIMVWVPLSLRISWGADWTNAPRSGLEDGPTLELTRGLNSNLIFELRTLSCPHAEGRCMCACQCVRVSSTES